MGPTWVLSAPDGPHVGPMNLAIRLLVHWPAAAVVYVDTVQDTLAWRYWWLSSWAGHDPWTWCAHQMWAAPQCAGATCRSEPGHGTAFLEPAWRSHWQVEGVAAEEVYECWRGEKTTRVTMEENNLSKSMNFFFFFSNMTLLSWWNDNCLFLWWKVWKFNSCQKSWIIWIIEMLK